MPRESNVELQSSGFMVVQLQQNLCEVQKSSLGALSLALALVGESYRHFGKVRFANLIL
jgi:hypothetical protein